ncbi:hypothetical protein GLE_1858 [Lysobacter enzymogenes]|uniref:Uncharacterized protein n=1 Tax=Lysobacter enzymogenes TaxID=69 RepID=A0A0S2DFC1_LYSEN|nr:hypothetical protein [Lysobacter enzymogenes]ALN57210.1 hypothetical protein GLE_1858 [Lysobacter enzymogenes]QCW25866.1 hypothetical protein FE772_09525 [Lysobacter enzymogenes]
MSLPDCQYSHITWLNTQSAAYQALTEGLKSPSAAPGAVVHFLETLTAAHQDFKRGLGPGADTMALLKAYQDKTGIVSTRDYTLPDIPNNPNDPGNSFAIDLIEGIAGAAETEIGIGISLYTLVLDLIELFDIKLHLQGVLFNTANTDLDHVQFRFGPNGQPNVLPLATTIPAAKTIMNPVDKKNYPCVGFALFGGVGYESLEGFYIAMQAYRKHGAPIQAYCQFYASDRGIAPGIDDRNHAPLRDVCYTPEFVGVMSEQRSTPNGIVAIFCG